MPETLQPYALTTLAKLREHLDRTEDATEAEDDELIRVINAKSNAMRLFAEREFVPAGDEDLIRTFLVEDLNGFVNLAPFDLRSVTSITLDGVALAETAYDLFPLNKTREDTYLWLELAALLPEQCGTRNWRKLEIEGLWGMEAIPPDVEHGCLVACSHDVLSPFGFAAISRGRSSFIDNASDGEWGSGLPGAVIRTLMSYVRSGII